MSLKQAIEEFLSALDKADSTWKNTPKSIDYDGIEIGWKNRYIDDSDFPPFDAPEIIVSEEILPENNTQSGHTYIQSLENYNDLVEAFKNLIAECTKIGPYFTGKYPGINFWKYNKTYNVSLGGNLPSCFDAQQNKQKFIKTLNVFLTKLSSMDPCDRLFLFQIDHPTIAAANQQDALKINHIISNVYPKSLSKLNLNSLKIKGIALEVLQA
jgi:hypothetical protein